MINLGPIKAAMFDFDGTITHKGQYAPPKVLADGLVDLSQKIPIGFCTGRQLESFIHRGLTELLSEISPQKRTAFLENLFLFAENGAIGYDFNVEKEVFEEFYRVDWPEHFISRETLKEELRAAIKDYGDIYDNAHRVVIVMRTNLHETIERDVAEVYELSAKMYEITLGVLRNFSKDFEKFLHVGNSGIGVIVGPANGDKDHAIEEFALLLGRLRGLEFVDGLRDILVVGDSPQVGGNDHYFLQGRLGTPFNVGEAELENPLLKMVYDEKGVRLYNASATLFLVRKMLMLLT